jgi:hypothetical protein
MTMFPFFFCRHIAANKQRNYCQQAKRYKRKDNAAKDADEVH